MFKTISYCLFIKKDLVTDFLVFEWKILRNVDYKTNLKLFVKYLLITVIGRETILFFQSVYEFDSLDKEGNI